MSRIGNMPVPIPSAVTVEAKGKNVVVKGSKGELSREMPDLIDVVVEDNLVQVSRKNESKEAKSLHGTNRSLIANMIEGVEKGFSRELVIEGVGYKAELRGQKLVLALGFSHEITCDVPDGLVVEVPKETSVKVSGIDRQAVGQLAARIRAFSPAEPYKGKGVSYKGERVRRKEGKTVA